MNKYLATAGIGIIAVIGIGLITSHMLAVKPVLATYTVGNGTIEAALSADGTVEPAQNLSLSFQTGGTVAAIPVSVGQVVKKGDVLARLDTKVASAAIDQAKASVAAASANYQKVISGATNATVAVNEAAVTTAQTALDNAKKNLLVVTSQQNVAVANALSMLNNTGLAATPDTANVSTDAPIISGNYTGTASGSYAISLFSAGDGAHFSYSGLENGAGPASGVSPVALGTHGLYIVFPQGTPYLNETWTVSIPNTKAPLYVTSLNAYNAALQTQAQALASAQAAVDSATAALAQTEANLNLTKTSARPEDVPAAAAQVAAANANLEAAQNVYSNSLIVAPIDGTITSNNLKIGETAAPGVPVLGIISNDQLQIDTYLSETEVGSVHVGDEVTIDLDAYGTSTAFGGKVIAIDPAATMQNGSATYKTTVTFDQPDNRIKAGMGASVIISDEKHENVVTVPSSAIFQNNGKTMVMVHKSDGTFANTAVVIGLTGNNGLTEIMSGLAAGDQVAYFGTK